MNTLEIRLLFTVNRLLIFNERMISGGELRGRIFLP